jgi:TP901 family phage tail tape measure protein
MADVDVEVGTDKAVKSVKRLRDETGRYIKSAEKADKSTRKFERGMSKTEKKAGLLAGAMKKLAVAAAAFFTIRAGAQVIKQMAAYETQLVAVGKTANISGKELKDMGKQIQLIAAQSPLTIKELLDIAAAAGQLGVAGTRDILVFTETVAKLGRVSDVAGEEGAKQLARLLGVTRESIQTIPRLAAVITELGNTSKATEAEILHTGLEVAKAAAIFDISSGQALAYGAALASIGVQAELASSVLGMAFRSMDKAIRAGGDQLDRLTAITGGTGKEIAELFGRDAPAAFNKFLRGLGKIKREGGDVTAAMKSIGLSGRGISKVLPALALNSDMVAKKFTDMAEAARKGTAAEIEFARGSDTLGGEIVRLGNVWDIWIAQLSDSNGPIKEVVASLADMLVKVLGLEAAIGKAGFDKVFRTGAGQVFQNLEQERKASLGRSFVKGFVGPQLDPIPRDDKREADAIRSQIALLKSLRSTTVTSGGASRDLLNLLSAELGGQRVDEFVPKRKLPKDSPGAETRRILTAGLEPQRPLLEELGITSGITNDRPFSIVEGQAFATAFLDHLISGLQSKLATVDLRVDALKGVGVTELGAPTKPGDITNITVPSPSGGGAGAGGTTPSGAGGGLGGPTANEALNTLRATTLERMEQIRLLQIELQFGEEVAQQEKARLEAAKAARDAFKGLGGFQELAVKRAGDEAAIQVKAQQDVIALLEQKDALEAASKEVENLQRGLDLIKATADERARMAAEQTLMEIGLSKEHEQYEKILATLTKINKAREDEKGKTKELTILERAKGDAADRALDASVEHLVNLRNGISETKALIQSLFDDLLRIAANAAISGIIKSNTTTSSALGNVFGNGRVIQHGLGAVVSVPSAFPMAGGNIGTIAEKSVEGIFPLGRNSRGELGVKSIDGGGKATIIDQRQITHNYFGVQGTGDAMRRSRRQEVQDNRDSTVRSGPL